MSKLHPDDLDAVLKTCAPGTIGANIIPQGVTAFKQGAQTIVSNALSNIVSRPITAVINGISTATNIIPTMGAEITSTGVVTAPIAAAASTSTSATAALTSTTTATTTSTATIEPITSTGKLDPSVANSLPNMANGIIAAGNNNNKCNDFVERAPLITSIDKDKAYFLKEKIQVPIITECTVNSPVNELHDIAKQLREWRIETAVSNRASDIVTLAAMSCENYFDGSGPGLRKLNVNGLHQRMSSICETGDVNPSVPLRQLLHILHLDNDLGLIFTDFITGAGITSMKNARKNISSKDIRTL